MADNVQSCIRGKRLKKLQSVLDWALTKRAMLECDDTITVGAQHAGPKCFAPRVRSGSAGFVQSSKASLSGRRSAVDKQEDGVISREVGRTARTKAAPSIWTWCPEPYTRLFYKPL